MPPVRKAEGQVADALGPRRAEHAAVGREQVTGP
jgi:hypothetical protein